ncbi:MAG: TIGR00159 family protein [Gemmatimonadetes bacterium]|nr:TIGR00159 family protein [Gemmatimonadota bacterium]
MIHFDQGALWIGFLSIRPTDVVDVAVVSFLTYKLFGLIRGTRAVPMFIGLFLIVIVSVLADTLRLDGLNYLVSHVRTVFLVAFVIVFQPELRRVLTRLGESRLLARYFTIERNDAVEEVVLAASKMAALSMGALIVLEREVGFRSIVEKGTAIRAKVSADLLTTIFTPNTPLHDGAVVVRGDQIVAAACILPLTQNPVVEKSLGTRHRAALGLTEETDAVVVIVSEETRQISLAHRGAIEMGLTVDELRTRLGEQFDEAWEAVGPAE